MNLDLHCTDEQLTYYHYGDLEPEQFRLCAAHLEGCVPCRERLHELEASLAAVPAPELAWSRADTQRFTAGVAERAQRRPARRLAAWGSALAAAGALTLTVVMLRPDTAPVTPGRPGAALVEFELIEQLDLLLDLDLLQNLDLLQEIGDLG